MRTFMIAAIIAGLAVLAHAQMGHGKGGGKLGQKSDEQTAVERQQKKNEDSKHGHTQRLHARHAGADEAAGASAIKFLRTSVALACISACTL